MVAQNSTIYHSLASQALQSPDAIALLAPDRPPLSYAQLLAHLDDSIKTLNALGLGRGDRVAIVLPNGAEMVTTFLAVSACATSAPLNPAYRAPEFDFYLSDLNAKALILQAGIDSPAREVAAAHQIPVIELVPMPEGAAGMFKLVGSAIAPTSTGLAEPEDVALVLHTSGTTSRPKIVPLTQANLSASAQNIQATLNLQPSDRCLNVMPLFHIHGLIAAVLASLTSGASVVCTPGFQATQFLEWLAAFRPTWYSAVPTMHQAILTAVGRHLVGDNHLRLIRSSSSALPPQVMTALEQAFQAPVIEAYGMTEATHQIASNPLPPLTRKPRSVGLAAGPKVAIMDAAGNLLAAEQLGEIVIQGGNVTQGYEANPQANATAFDQGWFRTGDQGFLDQDGYLFLTGRLKELINRGGEKISPREIDEVLLDHPAIAQAVAFAVTHSTLGEDVAAAVVLRSGAVVNEAELRAFVADRLAAFKVPSQIAIVPAIPKGATGKLQRIGLADKLADYLKPEFVPPQTAIELALADIWLELLSVETIGIHDNFFAIGGNSLLTTQVLSRVQAMFEIELSLSAFFQQPTIAALASTVEQESAAIAQLLAELENLSETEAQCLLTSSAGNYRSENHKV
jgi:acyl-CoA synthetase (AMP-forming)/AMP-acid ligase II/acyl carrier protein